MFFKKEKQKKEISTFKAARRALIASVVSLVVCFSMLSGTTFAWFTDSVSNTNNKIKAGYTDFEVHKYVSNSAGGGSYTGEVDTSTKVFSDGDGTDVGWKPGDVRVAYYKIKNTGNLDIILDVDLIAKAAENQPENVGDLSDYMVLKAIISNSDTYISTDTEATLKEEAGINVGTKTFKTNLFPAEGATSEVVGPNEEVYVKVIAYLPDFKGTNPKPLIFNDILNESISGAKCNFSMTVNAFQVIKDGAMTYKTCEWKDDNDSKLTLKQVPVNVNNKIWKSVDSTDSNIYYAFDEDSFKAAIQYAADSTSTSKEVVLLNDIFITNWDLDVISEFKGTIKSYSNNKFTIWGLNKRMFNIFNGTIERVVFKNSSAPNVHNESIEGDNNNLYVYNGILAAKASAQAQIKEVNVLYTDISDTPSSELVQGKEQKKYIGALVGWAEDGMQLDVGVAVDHKSTALGNRPEGIGLIGNRVTQ